MLSALLAGNRTARKFAKLFAKSQKVFDFSNFSIFSTFQAEISWNVNFSTFRLFEFFELFELFDFSTFRIFRNFDFSSRNLLESELFDFSNFSNFSNFSTFRVKLFYHGWSFQRKVAFEPPKQYTKLGTQGFLSYHLSSTRRQARSRFCGSRKCLARNPQKGRIDLGWDG